MDLTSPAFPSPEATVAIYHLLEEEIKVLPWRQYPRKKPINQKSEPHQISELYQQSEEIYSFEITGWSMRHTGEDNSNTAGACTLWRLPSMPPKWAKPNRSKLPSHLQKELVRLYPGRQVVGPKWLCHCSQLWLRDMKSRSMVYACWLEHNGKTKQRLTFEIITWIANPQ